MNNEHNEAMLPTTISPTGQAALIQAAAATREVEGFFVAAQRMPRDMAQVEAGIMSLCSNLAVAEEALYSYYKGGALVEGLSVDIINDIASEYGRIKNGWQVLDVTPTQTTVACYAIDYQNLKKTERIVVVRHVSLGGKPLTNQRDIDEMVANIAQRRMRACTEALIRTDILKRAQQKVIETLMNADTRPIAERIKSMVQAFAEFGVNEAMIRKWGNVPGLDAITLTQLVKLRAIYKSIKDGARVGTYFDVSLAPPPAKMPEAPKEQPKAEPEKKKAGRPAKAPKEEQAEAPKVPVAQSAPEPNNTPVSTPESTDAPPPEMPTEDDETVDAEPVEANGDDWASQFNT